MGLKLSEVLMIAGTSMATKEAALRLGWHTLHEAQTTCLLLAEMYRNGDVTDYEVDVEESTKEAIEALKDFTE